MWRLNLSWRIAPCIGWAIPSPWCFRCLLMSKSCRIQRDFQRCAHLWTGHICMAPDCAVCRACKIQESAAQFIAHAHRMLSTHFLFKREGGWERHTLSSLQTFRSDPDMYCLIWSRIERVSRRQDMFTSSKQGWKLYKSKIGACKDEETGYDVVIWCIAWHILPRE